MKSHSKESKAVTAKFLSMPVSKMEEPKPLHDIDYYNICYETIMSLMNGAIEANKAKKRDESNVLLLKATRVYTKAGGLTDLQRVAMMRRLQDWVASFLNIKELPAPNDDLARKKLEESTYDIRDGKLNVALEKAIIGLQLSPTLPDSFYISAIIYERLDRFQDALICFHLRKWINIHLSTASLKEIAEHAERKYSSISLARNFEVCHGMLSQSLETHEELYEHCKLEDEFMETDKTFFSQLLLDKSKEFFFEHDYEKALEFAHAATIQSLSTSKKKYLIRSILAAAKLLTLLNENDKAIELLRRILIKYPEHRKVTDRLTLYTERYLAENKTDTAETKLSSESSVKRRKKYIKPSTKSFQPKAYTLDAAEIATIAAAKAQERSLAKALQEKEEIEKAARREAVAQAEIKRQLERKARKENKERARVSNNKKNNNRRKTKNSSTRAILLHTASSPVTQAAAIAESKETKIASQESKQIVTYTFTKFLDAHTYPIAGQIPLQSFESDIIELLDGKCCLVGSTPRERVRQGLTELPKIFDMKQDRDFITSATKEEILTKLKKFNVKKTKKEGLFRFTAADPNGDIFEIQVFQTTHFTLESDMINRDFTVNSLYVTSDGSILDPSGQGLNDIKQNRIVPLAPLDPWRAIRALMLSEKNHMAIDSELLVKIRRNISVIKFMKDYFSIYSWILKSFSAYNVHNTNIREKMNFILKHDLLPHLFHPEDAKKIINDIDWICSELESGTLFSLQQIYMVFFTSLASQRTAKTEDIYQKEIYLNNPILRDALCGFSRFSSTYSYLLQAREEFFSKFETAPVAEVSAVRMHSA